MPSVKAGYGAAATGKHRSSWKHQNEVQPTAVRGFGWRQRSIAEVFAPSVVQLLIAVFRTRTVLSKTQPGGNWMVMAARLAAVDSLLDIVWNAVGWTTDDSTTGFVNGIGSVSPSKEDLAICHTWLRSSGTFVHYWGRLAQITRAGGFCALCEVKLNFTIATTYPP